MSRSGGPVRASGAGGRAEYGPSRVRRSWANRHNNCYISHMSNEKHFHGWLRSGRVFVMTPKVFTDRIACHRWAAKTASSEGRSAGARLLEVPGLEEVAAAGDPVGPRRSRTRRHAPGAQGGN